MQEFWGKKFLIIWIGQFISLISSSAVNFAIVIWLSIETSSAQVLAYAAIAAMLPQAIIGPVAGVFVDRWNKKYTMILADSFVAVCTLMMSINFYSGAHSLTLIYLLLALRSVGSAFHMPAMQAAIPMIAPKSELLRIAAINQLIQSVSGIAGPALGALMIGFFPIGQVLLFDIAGALIAVVSLFFVKIPRQEVVIKKSASISQVFTDMREGFDVVQKNKGLLALFVVSIFATFFVMPVVPLLPLMTIEYFRGGKFEMSMVEIVWSIGMLAGSGIISIWKYNFSKVGVFNAMNIASGIFLVCSGQLPSQSFVGFVILIGLCGAAYSVQNVFFMTLVQEYVSSEMLGRVFSLYFSLIVLPAIAGLFSTGFLANIVGLQAAFVILGLSVAVVGVISFFIPSLMAMDTQN